VNDRSPTITVLLPVRNGATTLPAAIRSILLQTLTELELLVVDDGSNDGTCEILRDFAAADARVRAVPAAGSGIVDALNTGLALARAAYVARMDADDLAHPKRLELQHAFARTRESVTVVGSLVECFPFDAVREGYRIYERWLNALVEPAEIARAMYVESPMAHPSVFFRRDAIVAVGGYRAGAFPEDYDLWLRLHRAGHSFAKVREILLSWRDHPERHSRRDPRYGREAFLGLKATHLARGPLAGRSAIVWGAGRIGRVLSRALIAHEIAIDAFIDIDPRKIGRRVRGALVLDPSALPAPGPAVLLAAVGVRDARMLIRRRALAKGYVEGHDFFCAA